MFYGGININLFYIIELIGVITFALSGIILARRKNFAPIGIYIIGFVTALGGGTLRDLILNRLPYWLSHTEFPLLIFLVSVIMFFLRNIELNEDWLVVPDALGLSLFSISGAQLAMELGYDPIIIIIMGTMTACFGGVIRDILCGEIPFIFQKVSFYPFASVVGITLYITLLQLKINLTYVTVISITFIFIFRLLAYKFNWKFN